MKRAGITALAAVCAVAVAPDIVADAAPTIDEWPVPYEDSRPRDPYVAPDGRVWFVGQSGDYVAWFDAETEEFGRWPLADGTGPHNLLVADDGFVWYAGNRAHHIGRLDPATGAIERIEMPDRRARDPHTLAFDADGDIWFTLQGANMVGFLDVESREVRLAEIATPRARPYGIVLDDDRRPWLNLLGTNRLATVDPATLEITEIETPRADARTRRIAWADGRVWYVDWAGGRLGAYDPESRAFEEWMLPGGEESKPYAMAADGEGRIWVFETGVQPNRLVGFDPATERFLTPVDVPSGAGTVRHAMYHAETDSIWFGTDANTLGRARLP